MEIKIRQLEMVVVGGLTTMVILSAIALLLHIRAHGVAHLVRRVRLVLPPSHTLVARDLLSTSHTQEDMVWVTPPHQVRY
jgi:hypothetical protein